MPDELPSAVLCALEVPQALKWRSGARRAQGKERNRDLLNIEVVAALNQAHCRLHHLRNCLPSEELARECGRARPRSAPCVCPLPAWPWPQLGCHTPCHVCAMASALQSRAAYTAAGEVLPLQYDDVCRRSVSPAAQQQARQSSDGLAAAGQAARIMQELDMEWERLAVEHFGGDLECADTQVRSYFSFLRKSCRTTVALSASAMILGG